MDLGLFSVSLAVEDVDESVAFYAKLGFEVIDGGHTNEEVPDTEDGRWRILRNEDALLGVFEGMFEENIITFNPPDVRAIQKSLKKAGVEMISEADEDGEGPTAAMLEDPDGNMILMDQP